ncbi:MAG: rhodanese-like domain-containing protein, partial [Actinomycetota bacterium]
MPLSYTDLIKQALAVVGELTPAEVTARMAAGPLVLIDCREPAEFESGVIRGASLVPRSSIETAVARSGLSPDTPIVVYCASGARSALAAKTLYDMGY